MANVEVTDYTAGNPSDDHTTGIQNAVNAAAAGDTVHFSSGTYYIRRGHNATAKYGVLYKPGVWYKADPGTIITTVDGEGEVWFFVAPDGGSDATFTGFEFDHKGTTRLIPAGSPQNNFAIGCANASSNIVVSDCKFINNSGNQCIFINYDNSLGTNYRINNNEFINMGYGVPGNDNNDDHSSIYISGHNGWVYDNKFINSRRGNITAIELHGMGFNVFANTAHVGGNFCIFASTDSDATGSVYGNTAVDTRGVILWPFSGGAVRDVSIYGNTIETNQIGTIRGVRPNVNPEQAVLKDITIYNNILNEVYTSTEASDCISIALRVDGFTVSENVCTGWPGFPISFQALDSSWIFKNILLLNNSFYDINTGNPQTSTVVKAGGTYVNYYESNT